MTPNVAGLFDAVVVGASAGGVDALKVLLPGLPATTRLPIVIVLHVPADRPSLLAEVFTPQCAVRVVEAEDKEPLDGGGVFFAPSGYHLVVDDRWHLSLSCDEPVHWSRPSIDLLFSSAASVYRERLMAVLLTGASSDGAEGLEAVRAAGGCTVVQTPSSASSPVMPEAALARLTPDHLLDLAGIAALLGAAAASAPSLSALPGTAGARS